MMMVHIKQRLLFAVFITLLLTQTKGKIIRQEHHFDAAFTLVSANKKLYDLKFLISIHNATDLYKCVKHCVRQEKCESMNYNEQEQLCEILDSSSSATEERLRFVKGWTHYETDPNARNIGPYCQTVSPCNVTHVCEDTFKQPPYICRCQEGFSGKRCNLYEGPGKTKHQAAASCSLLSKLYKPLENGFYWIKFAESVVKRLFCIIRSIDDLGKHEESAIKSCDWLHNSFSNFHNGYYWTWNKFENDTQFQLCDKEFEIYKFISSGNQSLLIDAMQNLIKNNMIRSLSKIGKEYRVRFELKVNEKSSDSVNVILFNAIIVEEDKHGSKYPAVSLKESTIYIKSSIGSTASYNYQYDILDLLGKWITIDISQIKDESNKFIYMIKINGEKVHEVINTSPREFSNVDIFAGSPWLEPAKAVIRNLELYGEFIDACQSLLINSQLKLSKDNLITTVPKMGSEYRVRFEMNVRVTSNKWINVIHFTTGQNKGSHGDRYPAVFHKNSDIAISSSVNEELKYSYQSNHIVADKWMSVDISQTKEAADKFVYSIRINGLKVKSVINKFPREFSNVKVYAADPWYSFGNTLIRKLTLWC